MNKPQFRLIVSALIVATPLLASSASGVEAYALAGSSGVEPELSLMKSHLFQEMGRPVGAALWVLLPGKMGLPRSRSEAWTSGARCWLVDPIGPATAARNKFAGEILGELQQMAMKPPRLGMPPGVVENGPRPLRSRLPFSPQLSR